MLDRQIGRHEFYGDIAVAKKGSGRVRVFFAEFEGDDDTVQSGIKAMAAAVNKTFESRRVIVSRPAPLEFETAQEDELVDDEYDEVLDSDVFDSTDNGSAKKKRVRKPPNMSLVKDLNLRPSGKQSLREFFEAKKPSNQWSQIVVFVYYLEKILEVESISPNHVYTCFKDVGKRAPKDTPQAIRNAASRKEYIDSSDQDKLRMTVPGENFIEHDLPGTGNGDE